MILWFWLMTKSWAIWEFLFTDGKFYTGQGRRKKAKPNKKPHRTKKVHQKPVLPEISFTFICLNRNKILYWTKRHLVLNQWKTTNMAPFQIVLVQVVVLAFDSLCWTSHNSSSFTTQFCHISLYWTGDLFLSGI